MENSFPPKQQHDPSESKSFTQTASDLLRNYLVKATAGSFFLKIVATLLNFLISVFFARILGAEGYGTYVYAITIITFLNVLALLGMAPLIVRKTAEYHSKKAWGLLKGLIITSNKAATIATLLVIALAYFFSVYIISLSPKEQKIFTLSLLLLPILTLTTLRQATIRGLKHVVMGQLPEMLIKPLMLITCIGGIYFFLPEEIGVHKAISLNIIASFIAFAAGVMILRSLYPSGFRTARAETLVPTWTKIAFPLFLISVFQITNASMGIIILGFFRDSSEVAYYSVAHRGASLVLFLLISVEMTVAPYISIYYSNKEYGKLQKLLTLSSRLCFGFTILISLAMVLLSPYYLNLFGPEFISGRLPLIILCFGVIINSFFGASGQLALMTGHERATSIIVGFTALLNLLLNIALVPSLGAIGSAIANITSTLIWNTASTLYIYRKTGLSSLPFSRALYGRQAP